MFMVVHHMAAVQLAYVTFHDKTNLAYCADNRFLVKATITKYNLWTIAPANLKSLARVIMEIWDKMYPDRPY